MLGEQFEQQKEVMHKIYLTSDNYTNTHISYHVRGNNCVYELCHDIVFEAEMLTQDFNG